MLLSAVKSERLHSTSLLPNKEEEVWHIKIFTLSSKAVAGQSINITFISTLSPVPVCRINLRPRTAQSELRVSCGPVAVRVFIVLCVS